MKPTAQEIIETGVLNLVVETSENDADHTEFHTFEMPDKDTAKLFINRLNNSPESFSDLEGMDDELHDWYLGYLGTDYNGDNMRSFDGYKLFEYIVEDEKIIKQYYTV